MLEILHYIIKCVVVIVVIEVSEALELLWNIDHVFSYLWLVHQLIDSYFTNIAIWKVLNIGILVGWVHRVVQLEDVWGGVLQVSLVMDQEQIILVVLIVQFDATRDSLYLLLILWPL